jgi:hypothetical protein
MKHTYVVTRASILAMYAVPPMEYAFSVEAASKAEAISIFTKLVKGRFSFRPDLTIGLVKEDIRAGNLIIRRTKALTKEKQA